MHRIPSPISDAIESLDLPSVPSLLLAFLQATASDKTSMSALADIVRREPALAARILGVANSAAFSRGERSHSIEQSMQRLGLRLLRSIAACLAVQGAFGSLSGARADDLAGFWRHSIFVAELARGIAAELGEPSTEEAYLAGLLHDIGELLLLGGLGGRYGELLIDGPTEEVLLGLEQARFGTDHAEVGAWLVDRWRLPSFLADAVRFHHRSAADVAAADPLTRILWAAHAGGLLAVQEAPEVEAYTAVGRVLPMDGLAFARLCGQASASVVSLAGALGVATTPPTQVVPLWREPPPVADATVHAELQAAALSMAALQPLQQDLSLLASESELLLSARESARILFGVADVAFLLVDESGQRWQAAALTGQAPQLARLPVARDTPGSACAEALKSGRPVSTFDTVRSGPVALADLQIARCLGSEGLLCVPMPAARGLMVCGVSQLQHLRLQARAALLSSFAGVAAQTLLAWRRQRGRERELEAEVAGRHRLRARQAAHEAGNPLGIIKNYLRIVDSKMPAAAALDGEISILRQEIDRVARILRQLDDDAVPGATGAGQLDLNSMLEGLRLLYGESLFGPAGVRLELQLQSPLALAGVDRDPVKQIVLNLWKNAAEAAPSGSAVTTATTDHVHQDGRLYTELRISDQGPGLPPEVLSSLYQPLDESRRPGHAGLGLSIVHGLVTKLGGHIRCQSQPQRGTTFIVLLPQAPAA